MIVLMLWLYLSGFALLVGAELNAEIDKALSPQVTVGDVMRPLEKLRTVDPATPLSEALKTMAGDDVNQLPVIEDGRLKGIVTRGHILQLLQSRMELNKAA